MNGRVPTALGALANLVTLDLSGNSLRSKIPSELGNASALSKLFRGVYNRNNAFARDISLLPKLWSAFHLTFHYQFSVL